jgi:hypothetical protein
MKRGLSATGFPFAAAREKSTSFGVLDMKAAGSRGGNRARDHDDAHAEDSDESKRQPANSRSRS